MNDSTYAHARALAGADRGPQHAPVEEQHAGRRRVPATGLVHGDAHGRLGRAASAGADVLGGTQVVDDIADALRRRRGRGAPLPDDVAGPMGEALGADLSAVRVHADREADALSRAVQARAFTSGTDVYFTAGTYDPASTAGRHLLAHELAHVAQATRPGAAHGGPLTIGRADDPAEAEADRAAARALSTLQSTPARGVRRTLDTTRAAGATSEPALVIHRDWADNLAARIGAGHSYGQHANEYNPRPSRAQFITLISNVLRSATNKRLRNGRWAYWLDGTIVIHDRRTRDQGTAFRPRDGRAYYDRQR